MGSHSIVSVEKQLFLNYHNSESIVSDVFRLKKYKLSRAFIPEKPEVADFAPSQQRQIEIVY
jgi:hypothetical protein